MPTPTTDTPERPAPVPAATSRRGAAGTVAAAVATAARSQRELVQLSLLFGPEQERSRA